MDIISKNLCQKNSQKENIAEKLQNLLKRSNLKTIEELLKQIPNKENMSMEYLFIAVYCVVNNFIDSIGGQRRLRSSNNNNPQFTDSEIMTIALVGHLAQQDSQNAWHNYVRKNFLYLFPNLCTRTCYLRRLARLHEIFCYFQKNLCSILDANTTLELVIDSFPLELCNMQRLAQSSQPFQYDGANFGFCSSKKLHYYGFKCHIVSDLRGIPIFVCLTSASMSDLRAFEFVVAQMFEQHIIKSPVVYIADKGYVGKNFQAKIQQIYGITLLSMEREYLRHLYGASPLNEFLKPIRKIIETSINLFSIGFHAGRTKCRTIKGLAISLISKLSAFNLANFFNYLMDTPILAVKGFVF